MVRITLRSPFVRMPSDQRNPRKPSRLPADRSDVADVAILDITYTDVVSHGRRTSFICSFALFSNRFLKEKANREKNSGTRFRE